VKKSSINESFLLKRIYSPWRMLSQAQVSITLRFSRNDAHKSRFVQVEKFFKNFVFCIQKCCNFAVRKFSKEKEIKFR